MTTDADSTPDTLTVADAAARAGKSERQVRRWLERGDVAHVRDDKGVRLVVAASLDAWLAAKDSRPVAPVAVAGLADLVAALATEQAARARLEAQVRDLEWRNGYQAAELEQVRGQLRQLTAGPVADSAPDSATAPDSAPTDVDDGPDSATAADSGLRSWWTRVRSRWHRA